MAFIYNNNRQEIIGFDPHCPIFVDGMSCANFQGQKFPFEEVDVSRMTDLSLFFANCENMQISPMIDVSGKTGLNTMLYGCKNLYILIPKQKVNQDITFYTIPETDGYAESLGVYLLNTSLEIADSSTTKILTLTLEMYNSIRNVQYWKNKVGTWLPYPTDPTDPTATFEELINAGGWTLAAL